MSENNTEQSTEILTSEEFLEKLKKALTQSGDFPASARIVNKLSELASNPQTTAQQIAEIILREPSLSARILSLVNSSFYRRAKPIMTISQAVVAIGMNGIAELCAGLVLIQRFAPLSSRGGAFASSLQKAIVTSLLSSSISSEISGETESKGNELGYLAGFFAEIGTLLLAYYFPKLYETAVKRSTQKNIPLEASLWQIIGHTPRQLSIEVLTSLDLPNFFSEVLDATNDSQRLKCESFSSLEEQKIIIAAKAVGIGYTLSTAIQIGTKDVLEKAINTTSVTYGVDTNLITNVLASLPRVYSEHCMNTQIPLPALPSYDLLNEPSSDQTEQQETITESSKLSDLINEIRTGIANKEPTASIVTSVLETLTFGLDFERAVLLLFDNDRRKLQSRMMIGKCDKVNASTLILSVDEDISSSYLQALKETRPIYQGEPILQNGWPFVIMPIGDLKSGIGILYADHINKDHEIDDRVKAYLGIISGLLDNALEYSKH